MRWVLLTIGGLMLLGIIFFSGWVAWSVARNTTPGPVACTQDAMQCPDGSYVGRTGPNCEFVCPTGTPTATTTTGGGGISPYNSGVEGTVMLGPTCPVEQNPPLPQCADKPYSTTVAIFRAGDPVNPYALTASAADGTFKVSLPPGSYVVGAGESNLPRCAQTPATVGTSGYTNIVVSCDTGIR